MEQKAVKCNMKAFRIFYISNGVSTTIYKLKSTNGKQALQTFIRHHWNGLKYEIGKVDQLLSNELNNLMFAQDSFFQSVSVNPVWYAERDGFATLFSEELR